MPRQSSDSFLASMINRLKSARAAKNVLRDSLNSDPTSPDASGVAFLLHTNSAQQDESSEWLLEDEEKDDRGRVNYIRPRCDSGESIATIRADTLTAGKEHKSRSTKHHTAPVPEKRRRTLKRCHAMRDLRFDGDNRDGHDDGRWGELDENDEFDGSIMFPTTTRDGLFAWMAPGSEVAGLPTRARDTGFSEIVDLISDEDEAARSLNSFARSALGCLQLHERFEVSIKLETKHIVMWDVDINHTYALEGVLYVKDAKAQTADLPLLPVESLSIDWHTVDSCRRIPNMTDDVIYATSFLGGLLVRHEVIRRMNPVNGIYTAVSWEWIPPGIPGTCVGGGWALRFWVPIPMWIFKGRDVASSLVSASVVFRDGDSDYTFTAEAGTMNVTIEHLMRGRDMKVSGRS
ncbi:uncharacterized protein B0H18DRAFT_520800 [Fomitopsis serialis]|uniref:uncharacterized protein n=1 Tax=Fomitopsis serialis TaxID=139415 RepID=UPI002008A6EF|nr:uncharacterized protein B0H18DRAFT_520800 [Neoantrodia serialis]KAH9910138.1 hypothetical protein B0H18DRAFT_520800 [Neoantrodia serialis]